MATAKLTQTATGYGIVPAAVEGNTVISPSGGTCCRALVTSTGTALAAALVQIYDNAATASGNAIYPIPGNAAAGETFDIACPVYSGITVAQVLNGPGLTITFN